MYTTRETLASSKVKVDCGTFDEELHMVEQIHATIIIILLSKDLQNHKIKNRVRKNCCSFLLKKPYWKK
jgi:hypothetical protein